MTRGLSSSLDASRWIAALMVVISHLHHIVLANFVDVQQKEIWWKATYFVGSFGREAVVIFFVVSGFLVGGITAAKWWRLSTEKKPFEMKLYWAQRFARIYIVLIPALIIGFVFDILGSTSFDVSGIYANSVKYHTISINSPIVNNLHAEVFIGNIFMLQNIVVSVLGSNGPLWSLAYEWWYYCIFAAALGFVFYRRAGRLLCLLCLCSMLILLPAKILLWMLIWLLGVVAYFYAKSNYPRPRPATGFLIFLAALVMSRFFHSGAGDAGADNATYSQFLRDFLLGTAYMVALLSFTRIESPIFMAKTHGVLASFSYSIYLTHFPAMLLMVAVAHDSLGIKFLRQPTILSYIYFFVLLIFIYLLGYLFYFFTECHTKTAASFLKSGMERFEPLFQRR